MLYPPSRRLTLNSTLADLPCHYFEVSAATLGKLVAEKFEQHSHLPGVMIRDRGSVVGMISRARFFEWLSRPYGLEIFLKRPIAVLSNTMQQRERKFGVEVKTLYLSASYKIHDAVELALSRSEKAVYEPIVVEFGEDRQGLLDLQVLLVAQSRLFAIANQTIERQKDAAIAANRAKSQFLANMSHELRTPLNAILGYSEMLQEDAQDLGQEDFLPDLHKIHHAGKHLLGIINDILDLSKIEAGKMELYVEAFDLSEAIAEVVSTIDPLIAKNNNTFELHCAPELGWMRADLTKVRQNLFNLLSNAAKFTHQGKISLDVSRGTLEELGLEKNRFSLLPVLANNPSVEWVCFTLTDSGIGMSPEQVNQLFQAFTQADASTTRKYGGTGLGLAIAKKFSQMMGGDILATSILNKGSTFTMVLPASTIEQVESEVEPTSVPLPAELPENAKLVLAIDDDSTVRELMQRFLSREGFRVAIASTGQEGLQLAQELQPDAITLDVMMPHQDGWSVLCALKSDPQLAHIPVIMLTMLDDKNMGMALGASDYMTKPIDRARLLAILEKYEGTCSEPKGLSVKGRSLLIVEDDPATRDIMRRFLEPQGWQISEAENGRRGLEQMAKHPPQLILLDLMMPEMDGFAFVAALKNHPQWRAIPIVVMTAKDITVEDELRLRGCVEAILHKQGSNFEQLFAEICQLVAEVCLL
ncbi:response regulator [Phormidium sp. CCY1219]|uniref:response regulator n=1 Tax=Phormidium sp. CCY1219 TaxID=2886104 RepID=UPI002D1EC674|nr:response regulator [Phormidium sp. CCY1219]MEB3829177.1 response regulator [Phormidium sp. CCY1219]